MNLATDALQSAANEARGLAMDAVHACSSGHLGLPLGCAEIGAVLFGHSLNYDPAEPRWLNRDRFVLSAGHGSMFLYGWLHLAGYAQLSIEQVKAFRAPGSFTPGHPEAHETDGVECTTGPLGQGVANAVGIAVSQKMAAARFNTAEHTIFHNHVIVLAGDGCLQEGVSAEASAYAGHNHLDNLILIYDSNDVTLDAMADASQSEDTAMRYASYGWHVQHVDGHDFHAIAAAIENARNTKGKPHFIIAKTLIGKGIPEVAGTAKAHGEPLGTEEIALTRAAIGWDSPPFEIPQDVYADWSAIAQGQQYEDEWNRLFASYQTAHPALAAAYVRRMSGALPKNFAQTVVDTVIDAHTKAETVASRKASQLALEAFTAALLKVEAADAQVQAATKAQQVARDRYNAGAATQVDVIQADRDLFQGYVTKFGLQPGLVKKLSNTNKDINRVDFQYSQELPALYDGHKIKVNFDVRNVLNLINRNWGKVSEYNDQNTLTRVDCADANGVAVPTNSAVCTRYRYSSVSSAVNRTTNNPLSLWYLQIGLRYEF
jgi:transketolase